MLRAFVLCVARKFLTLKCISKIRSDELLFKGNVNILLNSILKPRLSYLFEINLITLFLNFILFVLMGFWGFELWISPDCWGVSPWDLADFHPCLLSYKNGIQYFFYDSPPIWRYGAVKSDPWEIWRFSKNLPSPPPPGAWPPRAVGPRPYLQTWPPYPKWPFGRKLTPKNQLFFLDPTNFFFACLGLA